MTARWLVLISLAACSFEIPVRSGDAGQAPPDSMLCFGSYVQVCFESAANIPTSPKTWPTSADIDTDATTSCDQNIKQRNTYCVVTGAGMMLADVTMLRAHGSKPLILLSTMAVNLQGSVDVSSSGSALATRGAGGNPAGMCGGAGSVNGNSGGAGGSFAGQGGDGQRLDTANSPTAAPPVSGFPRSPRGGCPGGNGAKGDTIDAGGAGGSGGGAVAIIAPNLTFNGKINASGAGGTGGPVGKSGGGGGGSGGMIVLDVPAAGINRGSNGVLFANGGGGGEGGADPSTTGVAGASPTAPTPAAIGGSSTAGNDGGNGGSGSSGTDLGGLNAAGQAGPAGGGGAGGGGAGYIYAPGITGASISPPSQNLPSH